MIISLVLSITMTVKMTKKSEYTGKKEPTNPSKKEQHTNRKTKEELEHRWENDDWQKQLKDFLNDPNTTCI